MTDRSDPRRQRGQTLPLVAVFMVVLIGFAGFAIDAGHWWLTKRQLQSSVDAAALAGASQMPRGWSIAQATAQANYAQNGQPSDVVSYHNTTAMTNGDSVTVTATRTDQNFFTQLFGIGSTNVTATARATIETVQTVTNGDGIMPFGVMQGTFTYGQSVSLFSGNSFTGNFGAIDLPVSDSCSDTPGASAYSNNLSGANTICPVSVGDPLPTETGQMAGPTGSGMSARIGSNTDTLSDVISTASGQPEVLKQSPRLVLIPVILNTDGSTNWPSGKKDIQVVGFAYFFITSYSSKQVTGQFVQYLQNSTTGDTSGAYQPSSGSPTVVALTQ